MASLKQALQDPQQALEAPRADDPKSTLYLYEQGAGFWDRFERTNQLNDLDQAVRCYQQALTVTLSDNPDRARFLGDLGLIFEDRFLKTDKITDLEQSIRYNRQALELTRVDDRKRSKYLFSLGVGCQSRFAKTGQTTDLEQAIQYHQQALEAIPEDDLKTRTESFYRLGVVFRDRFQTSGQLDDLKQSIRHHEQALQGLPAGSTKLRKCLNMLGVAFGRLFERMNTLEDLEQSIWYHEQALEAGPAEHPDWVVCMGNLGLAYGDRFDRTGRMADLDRFIQYTQQAYEATPVSDNITRAKYLGSIGAGLGNRFERTGQMADLEQSIQLYQQALEATPHDDPDHVLHLSNLGVGFEVRFRRTDQISDLEQCIKHYQQVLESISVDDRMYARHLNNLGAAYGQRFQRMDQIADLDQCINYHQRAVDATSAHDPERPRSLGLLGNRLGFRYQRTGEMADLEQYLKYAYQAVESSPADHPERAGLLSILGNGFRERFKKMNQMTDMDKSIEYSQQAVEATPEDHPQRARYLFVLGLGLADRSLSSEDLRSSTEAFQKALSCSVGVPIVRISAGIYAVDNLLDEEKWNAAADTLSDILRLLPDVTPTTNSRDDMQHTLGLLSRLASLSTSVFLKAGKSPLEALQALERARGVIASFLIDARSDTSILKENHPELWSRYTHCQREITAMDSEISSADSQQSYAAKSSQRTQLFKTLHSLRDEIRQCPGFERFLLSLTEDEIRDLARTGPVVCFNVSKISSEAFLIMTTGIHALPLPSLKIENVRRQVRLFASRGNPARRDATLCEDDEDELPPIPDLSTELRSIWDSAVKPVLQQVGFLAQVKPSNKLPRIWWVGGGIMALLPLHAAGDHAPGSSENTLSHAVSSFAPTLRLLQFIQTRSPFSIREQKPEILIVSMPTTPGTYKPLNVTEEVASIVKYSGSVASTRHLERPTREAVLNALKSCAIAHFACHGSVDETEPAKSALIVGQDTEERLTVADLDTITHDRAQIAYLSACSTAEIQALNLVEESIHLASTFQLSGFQHVIGTLWGAEDSAAAEIASKFYKLLLQRSENGELSVAQALHDAVLCFRNTDNNHMAISQWAPFIHLGC